MVKLSPNEYEIAHRFTSLRITTMRPLTATTPAATTKCVRQVRLPSGTLQVTSASDEPDIGLFCSFAARENPRRPFLFVSKFNGRYKAIKPSELDSVASVLAEQIPEGAEGPVLFVAIAEAGVAVASSVHSLWMSRTQRQDSLLVQTTRHTLTGPIAATFHEPHSHAREHRIYWPTTEAGQSVFRFARTVVLIDDEITTGNTLQNAATSIKTAVPTIENVVQLVLTDWSDGTSAARNENRSGLRTTTGALWTGCFRFTPNGEPSAFIDPTVHEHAERIVLPTRVSGRGQPNEAQLPKLPAALRTKLLNAGSVLVVGTDEHQAAPLSLARELEAAGIEASFQATTRAPVRIGGAIQSRLEFPDTYGGNFTCFLYNISAKDHECVVICTEDERQRICSTVVDSLNADVIQL